MSSKEFMQPGESAELVSLALSITVAYVLAANDQCLAQKKRIPRATKCFSSQVVRSVNAARARVRTNKLGWKSWGNDDLLHAFCVVAGGGVGEHQRVCGVVWLVGIRAFIGRFLFVNGYRRCHEPR